MTVKVGINGFGRMGRLVLRAAWQWPEFEFVQINDPAGDAECFAHLMNFDSVHGSFDGNCVAQEQSLLLGQHQIVFTRQKSIEAVDWSSCDLVIEASGKFKSQASLQAYFDQGVKRVLVTAPVKEPGVLDTVLGVNDHLFDPAKHRIVTAASCTTNCLAPVVKVIKEAFGIVHGSFTTIHDITNTQSILDQAHKDLRRARACGQSLIPTSTGSATAIMEIFPELKGRLDGHAVRVPLANASLTDCVFELAKDTTAEEVNEQLKLASETHLSGVLGYETRPLVSVDFKTDPRSSIIDALSTRVINSRHVKIYAWYDNEWGYANRSAELAKMLAQHC